MGKEPLYDFEDSPKNFEPLIRSVCFCLFIVGAVLIASYPLGCQYLHNTKHPLVMDEYGEPTGGFVFSAFLWFVIIAAGTFFAFTRAFPAWFPDLWKRK